MNHKTNIPSLPLTANVCNQMLREVTRTQDWSLAHVIMNPGAQSLHHFHQRMWEVYAITRGVGELRVGKQSYIVMPGSVVVIRAGVNHQMFNIGASSLEHFVLAAPAFDPSDIVLMSPTGRNPTPALFELPPAIEAIDGAKVIPYQFDLANKPPGLNLSFAFGWTAASSETPKPAHFHHTFTEYMYVVEGSGQIILNSMSVPVKEGDWIEVPPGTAHTLRNRAPENLVVLCVCSPEFSPKDVYYVE